LGELDFSYEKDPFSLTIRRQSSNEIIFSLEKDFIYSDKYLEFTTQLASENVFGLGERFIKNLKLKPGIYNLFARDEPMLIDDGRLPGKSVYSSHPVYL
jgi:alpha-glucosidase/lysosomal alpha-glucosidase